MKYILALLLTHPPPWEYDGGEVRQLDNQGGLHKHGDWFFICEALAKQWVRVDELNNKLTVTFRHLTIREIDLETKSSTTVLLQRLRRIWHSGSNYTTTLASPNTSLYLIHLNTDRRRR